MSRIIVENLSVKFRIYHNKAPSLKEALAGLFRKGGMNPYSDFIALNDISFQLNKGDRVGIIGHNGAGKSTLLKVLCRVYEPLEGLVNVQGKIAPLLEIGAGFHPEFTGRENIYFNGSLLGYKRQEIAKIEQSVIEFAQVEEFIDTPVKYYSTGMYTRLAFSLATAMHPDILILDEIFNGGDASFKERATERMNALIDKANIMIMVSHDTELIKSLCNRVLWLDHGKLIADGNPDDMIDLYLNNDKKN
jgi:ABC-type polysaccharide/polyol phosphate transport system ATPase subunit